VIGTLDEVAADFPARFRERLVQIVLDLCHPDPALRGRTGAGGTSNVGLLWLQRYASRFDILEKEARIKVPDHV
jgi:eukaryotic-like serine/threonine-protein kinase